MSLINFTPLSDGTSIDAADINTPITSIVDVVNGNLDASNISSGSLTPTLMTSAQNLNTWRAASVSDFASGCVWTQSAGLIGAMTGGTVYIDGTPVSVLAIVSKTFTASKDTYVDVGTDGTVDYTEVANGAASPALAASHFRLAKVVTNGSAITNSTASAAVPSFQQGIDSLGNTIYNTSPYGITKWYFPSLINSWVDYDTASFQKTCYGKNKAGMVQVYGLVKSGTIGADVFVLPVGYRPTVSNIFPVHSNGTIGRLDIQADGSMFPQAGSNVYFSVCVTFQATGGN